MKKIIIMILLVFPVGLTGCTDWLIVDPKTEKSQDDIFSTQQGFQDVLTGIYLIMTYSDAYGSSLSYNMIEYMGSLYDPVASSTELELQLHNWGDNLVELKIHSTFAQLYKIISGANSILEFIDDRKDVFKTTDEYKWIKGEALAIRAMCHFDILRLFGPVPSQTDGKRILPYVTEFGYKLTQHSTWDEYCQKILKDLSDAEELLEDDPICHYSISDIGNPNSTKSDFRIDDTYFAYRFYRCNYYAVKALQARVNLWIGNNEDALAAAEAVISAKNPDGTTKFVLGTADSFSKGDRLFTSEHLMALHCFTLQNSYAEDFATGKIYKGKTDLMIKYFIYDYSTVDIRSPGVKDWWKLTEVGDASLCVSDKYFTDDQTNNDIGKRIPLLRLAEMYLIAVETAPIEKAQMYYDTFLRSRNVSSVPLSQEDRIPTIRKEYLKEFYAEGYAFYLYKRLNSNASEIVFSLYGWEPDYVLPLPSDELTYSD